MAGYERLAVDLTALDDLARALENLVSRLGDPTFPEPQDVGSPSVAAALERFEDRAREARHRVADSATALAAMACESARAYRAADETLARREARHQ